MNQFIKKIEKIAGRHITDSRDMANIYETREMGTMYSRDMETVSAVQHKGNFDSGEATREIETTEKQKTVVINYDSLLRWAVDLHHTRRNEQSGFQSVTQLLGFTHPHRNLNYKLNLNKNNLRIASKAVFSSLLSAMLPIETRYYQYTPAHRDVKKLVDNKKHRPLQAYVR